jgi:hypothetical protein
MTVDEQRALVDKSAALARAAAAGAAAAAAPAAPPPAEARALPLGHDRHGTAVWRLRSAPALTGAPLASGHSMRCCAGMLRAHPGARAAPPLRACDDDPGPLVGKSAAGLTPAPGDLVDNMCDNSGPVVTLCPGRADGLLLAAEARGGQAWQALGDPAVALAALDPAGRREAALRVALAAAAGLELGGAPARCLAPTGAWRAPLQARPRLCRGDDASGAGAHGPAAGEPAQSGLRAPLARSASAESESTTARAPPPGGGAPPQPAGRAGRAKGRASRLGSAGSGAAGPAGAAADTSQGSLPAAADSGGRRSGGDTAVA